MGGYGTTLYNAGVGGWRRGQMDYRSNMPVWETVIPPVDSGFDNGALTGAMLAFMSAVILPEIYRLYKKRKKKKSSNKDNVISVDFADTPGSTPGV